MSEETWSDEELAQQKLATMDSVGIVERIRKRINKKNV